MASRGAKNFFVLLLMHMFMLTVLSKWGAVQTSTKIARTRCRRITVAFDEDFSENIILVVDVVDNTIVVVDVIVGDIVDAITLSSEIVLCVWRSVSTLVVTIAIVVDVNVDSVI